MRAELQEGFHWACFESNQVMFVALNGQKIVVQTLNAMLHAFTVISG